LPVSITLHLFLSVEPPDQYNIVYSDLLFFHLAQPRPPSSTLFPYTTLFRSCTASVMAMASSGTGSVSHSGAAVSTAMIAQRMPSPGERLTRVSGPFSALHTPLRSGCWRPVYGRCS